MMKQIAGFNVGEIVLHAKFGYRGVIVDVDPEFSGTQQWYDEVAVSRPAKDQPWYHILVDESDNQTTYVAEQNLRHDISSKPIEHSYLNMFFSDFERDRYRHKQTIN